MNKRAPNNLTILPIPMDDGPAFFHLPARTLTKSEAKRLANIIYTWGPDSYGKLQVVHRDEKGKFVSTKTDGPEK